MTTTLNAYPSSTDWKTLYKAAILETQSAAIRQRVTEAESAVLARGREVFYHGGSIEEKEALEDALYILRAFRTACECTPAPLGGAVR